MSQKVTVSKNITGTLYLPSLNENVEAGQILFLEEDILRKADVVGAISRKLLILGQSSDTESNHGSTLDLQNDEQIKIINKKSNDLCFDEIRIEGNMSIFLTADKIMTSFAKMAVQKGIIECFDRYNNKILINNFGQFYKINKEVKSAEIKDVQIQSKQDIIQESKKEEIAVKKKGGKSKKKTEATEKTVEVPVSDFKEPKDPTEQSIDGSSSTNPLVWNVNEQKGMTKQQSLKEMFSKKKNIDLNEEELKVNEISSPTTKTYIHAPDPKDTIVEPQTKNKSLNKVFKKLKNQESAEDQPKEEPKKVNDLIKKLNSKGKFLPSLSLPKREDIKFVDGEVEDLKRIQEHPVLSQLNNNEVK